MDFKVESKLIFGGFFYILFVEGMKVVWLGVENGVWNLKIYVMLKNLNLFFILVLNFEFEVFVNGIKVGVGNIS